MNEHLCLLVGLHLAVCSQHFCEGSGPFFSPELNSFLLIMCIDAPESRTNSRSSGLVEVGAGIPFFNWSFERSFV